MIPRSSQSWRTVHTSGLTTPPMCTPMTAAVFSVNAGRTVSTESVSVCASMSTRRGVAPACTTAAAVAKNVLVGTITSRPATPIVPSTISNPAGPPETATAYRGLPRSPTPRPNRAGGGPAGDADRPQHDLQRRGAARNGDGVPRAHPVHDRLLEPGSERSERQRPRCQRLVDQPGDAGAVVGREDGTSGGDSGHSAVLDVGG